MKLKKWYARLCACLLAALTAFMIMPLSARDIEAIVLPGDSYDYEEVPYSSSNHNGFSIDALNVMVNGVTPIASAELKDEDKIKFTINWSYSDSSYSVDSSGNKTRRCIVIDLAEQCPAIDFTDKTFAQSGDSGQIANHYIIGNKLYIAFKDNIGETGKTGRASIDGTLDITKLGDNGSNKILKLFEDDIPVNIYREDSSIYVSKKTSGSIGYDAGGYYQDYTIEVSGSAVYDNNTLNNVTITETVPAGCELELIDSAIPGLSFTRNGNDYTASVASLHVEGQYYPVYQIKCRMRLPSGQFTISGKNKVTVDSDETEPAFDEEAVVFTSPWSEKTGTYSKVTGKIQWTVTVYAGSAKNSEITINDILGDHAGTIDSLPAYATATGNGFTMNIPASAFTDGKYVFTYDTTVSDADRSSEIALTAKNKVETYPKDHPEFKTEKEGSAAIPAAVSDVTIDKQFVSDNISGNNHEFVWTAEISVPDVPLASITVTDKMTIDNEWTPSNRPADITGVGLDIISVTADGIAVPVGDWTAGSTYSNDSSNNYTITCGSPNDYRGKTVKLTYKVYVAEADIANAQRIINSADVNVKTASNNNKTASDTAEKGFLSLKTTKRTFTPNDEQKNNLGITDDLNYPICWSVSLQKASDENFSAGQVITVTDTLTCTDFKFVGNTVKLCVTDSWGGDSPFRNEHSISTASADINTDGNKLTVTITLNDELAARLNASDNGYGYNLLNIGIVTDITAEKYTEYLNDGQTHEIKNKAVTDFSGRKSEGEATKQYSITSGNVIAKTITGSSSDISGQYADYKIEINPEKAMLNSGNPMTVTDTLGSRLTYVEGSVSVSPNGQCSFDGYDAASKKLTFTIPDKTACVITYKVKVKQIPLDGQYTDEEIRDMFGNAVEISGISSYDTQVVLNESVYRSEQSSSSDTGYTKINISGTKTWVNNNYAIDAPSRIEITLEQYQLVGRNGAVDTTKGENGDGIVAKKTIIVTPDINNNGEWSYSVEDLIVEDRTGSESNHKYYKWKLAEVKIDGYTAAYSANGSSYTPSATLGSDTVLNITNSFTAPEVEKGKVVITKRWSGGDAASRPVLDSRSIYIRNQSTGGVIYATSYSAGDQVYTFDDLPIYTYSRGSDDKLIRTPVKYLVEENISGSYTMSVSGSSDNTFVLDSRSNVTAPPAVLPVNKNITVTNTYDVNSFEVKISKRTINGTSELLGAKLEVYRIDDSGRTLITSWTSGNVEKTITLHAGNYVLVEKTAPDGYEIAEEIRFTVNNDGTVSTNAETINGVIIMRDEIIPEVTTTVSESEPEETTTVSEETTTSVSETTVPEETTTTISDSTATTVPEETTTGNNEQTTITSSENTVTSQVTSVWTTETTTDTYYYPVYYTTKRHTPASGEDVAAGAGMNADDEEVSKGTAARVLIPTGLFLTAAFTGLAVYLRKSKQK